MVLPRAAVMLSPAPLLACSSSSFPLSFSVASSACVLSPSFLLCCFYPLPCHSFQVCSFDCQPINLFTVVVPPNIVAFDGAIQGRLWLQARSETHRAAERLFRALQARLAIYRDTAARTARTGADVSQGATVIAALHEVMTTERAAFTDMFKEARTHAPACFAVPPWDLPRLAYLPGLSSSVLPCFLVSLFLRSPPSKSVGLSSCRTVSHTHLHRHISSHASPRSTVSLHSSPCLLPSAFLLCRVYFAPQHTTKHAGDLLELNKVRRRLSIAVITFNRMLATIHRILDDEVTRALQAAPPATAHLSGADGGLADPNTQIGDAPADALARGIAAASAAPLVSSPRTLPPSPLQGVTAAAEAGKDAVIKTIGPGARTGDLSGPVAIVGAASGRSRTASTAQGLAPSRAAAVEMGRSVRLVGGPPSTVAPQRCSLRPSVSRPATAEEEAAAAMAAAAATAAATSPASSGKSTPPPASPALSGLFGRQGDQGEANGTAAGSASSTGSGGLHLRSSPARATPGHLRFPSRPSRPPATWGPTMPGGASEISGLDNERDTTAPTGDSLEDPAFFFARDRRRTRQRHDFSVAIDDPLSQVGHPPSPDSPPPSPPLTCPLGCAPFSFLSYCVLPDRRDGVGRKRRQAGGGGEGKGKGKGKEKGGGEKRVEGKRRGRLDE